MDRNDVYYKQYSNLIYLLDMAVLPDLTVQTDTKILKQHIVMVSERLASGAKLYKPAKRSKVSTSNHVLVILVSLMLLEASKKSEEKEKERERAKLPPKAKAKSDV